MSPRRLPCARAVAAAIGFGLVAGTLHAATVQVTVLGLDGKPLPEAVVIIEPAQTAGAAAAPPAPVKTQITQQKMQFVPALSVIPLGSTVVFTNLDGWEHHVRGLPGGLAGLNAAPGSGFEVRLGGKVEGKPAESATVVLDRAGPLQLGCHIHGSMRGNIFVADTPWAVKTDAQGVALVLNVPEGAGRLRIWHAEQLVEAAPLAITVLPLTALSVPTRITPRGRRL